MEIILNEVGKYLELLDWTYVFSFTLIAYIFSKDEALTTVWKESGSKFFDGVRKFILSIPKGVRVLVLGLAYGLVFYWWRGETYHGKDSSFILFQSFLFTVAFHGILLKYIGKWFEAKMGISKKAK